jgi:hypothetical protein
MLMTSNLIHTAPFVKFTALFQRFRFTQFIELQPYFPGRPAPAETNENP